jgi:hypothetical protein
MINVPLPVLVMDTLFERLVVSTYCGVNTSEVALNPTTGFVPVPVNTRESGVENEVLGIVTAPVFAPAVRGEKTTPNVHCEFVERLAPLHVLEPENAYSPLMVSVPIVIDPVPMLVSTTYFTALVVRTF